jgi:hypothetical protein
MPSTTNTEDFSPSSTGKLARHCNAGPALLLNVVCPVPNAAPLMAKSAKLSDSQRDALAKTQGRTQFDPSADVWFNTALFPTQAQAPFTLRTFPTRFPDVRSKPLNTVEFSAYKEIPIHERVRWQIRADFHNALNHPFFDRLASNDVANAQFGRLGAGSIDDTSEPRLIVLAMKIVF